MTLQKKSRYRDFFCDKNYASMQPEREVGYMLSILSIEKNSFPVSYTSNNYNIVSLQKALRILKIL